MIPLKTIVVATDMSLLARHAEERAAMLAQEVGCESLHLLHVVGGVPLEPLGSLVRGSAQAKHELMESMRERMSGTERRLFQKYHVPITVTTPSASRVDAEIVGYAKSVGAELVVLGAHSGGIIRQMFVGSTVDKVLRTLPLPVLIVKQEPVTPYQQILVPIDFSSSSPLGIEAAMSMASGGKITALHAFEAPYEAKLRFDEVSEETIQAYRAQLRAQKDQELRQFAARWESPERSLSPTIEFGPAAAVIREKAKSLESDLIVIGRHEQAAWEDVLLGSVTKQVIQEASCDILVVRPETPRNN